MPKRTTLHVVRRSDGWAVRKEGNSRAVSTHTTQREAIDAAREVALSKHGELIIHRKDGRIRDRDSYSSDPLPPKSPGKVLFHPAVNEKAKKAIQAAVRIALKKSGRHTSQHVLPHAKGWVIRGEGEARSSSIYGTQSEAIQAAKQLLRKTDGELLIHGRHGEIRRMSAGAQKSRPTKPQ